MPRSWDNPNFFERIVEGARARRRRHRQTVAAWEAQAAAMRRESELIEQAHRERIVDQARQISAMQQLVNDRLAQEIRAEYFPPLQNNAAAIPSEVIVPGHATPITEQPVEVQTYPDGTTWYTYNESSPIQNRCRNYFGKNEPFYTTDILVEVPFFSLGGDNIRQWVHKIRICRQHVQFDGEKTLMQELFEQEPFKSRTTL